MKNLQHLLSHGMSEWLLQRVTAIVMTLYITFLAVMLTFFRPADYMGWKAQFDMQWFKLATFAFFLSLLLHGWIGMRDVLSDYVKHKGLCTMLRFAVGVALVAFSGWALQILWGNAA